MLEIAIGGVLIVSIEMTTSRSRLDNPFLRSSTVYWNLGNAVNQLATLKCVLQRGVDTRDWNAISSSVRLLAKFSKSGKVDLSCCNLTHLPRPEHRFFDLLAALEIKSLNLDDNLIRELPSKKTHIPVKLRFISARRNMIEDVPPAFAQLEKFKLSGNPLGCIGADRHEWSKIKKYVDQTVRRAANWTERKLLFVGQEGTGKTTLVCVCGSEGEWSRPS